MADRPPVPSLLASGVLLAALAVAATGCVRFQPATLYDGVEPAPVPERPRKLALAVEPLIYEDQNDDTIWFQDDARCTQGRLTEEVVYEGRRAVEVSWDRGAEGCEWAGLGFGWDNWAGKDLSEVLPYAAVQMHVRTKEGKMYGLPIVMTLEDYSGGMGFAYTGNRYFERPFIDEEWQTVTVPLAAFELEEENLDPTNVKQLMFELQQSGSLYIDDVQARCSTRSRSRSRGSSRRPAPTRRRSPSSSSATPSSTTTAGASSPTPASPSRSPARRPPEARCSTSAGTCGRTTCYRGEMGVSWDKWYPVDVTAIAGRAAIQLDVRLASGAASSVPVQHRPAGLRQAVLVGAAGGELRAERAAHDRVADRCTIPFGDLVGDADLSNVQQLLVRMDGAGEVFIDNLRLVEDV